MNLPAFSRGFYRRFLSPASGLEAELCVLQQASLTRHHASDSVLREVLRRRLRVQVGRSLFVQAESFSTRGSQCLPLPGNDRIHSPHGEAQVPEVWSSVMRLDQSGALLISTLRRLCRHVVLTPDVAKLLPKNRLLSEVRVRRFFYRFCHLLWCHAEESRDDPVEWEVAAKPRLPWVEIARFSPGHCACRETYSAYQGPVP